MILEEIDYTLASTDDKSYNRVDSSLTGPVTRRAKVVVTSLTTNCNIIVLNTDDWIIIDGKRYYFTDDYTDLNSTSFKTILNTVIDSSGVITSVDNAGRIVFKSHNAFVISDCSYNVMLLTGLYSSTFPIASDVYDTASSSEYGNKLVAGSVGYFLSTSILYLVSNVGNQSYRPAGRLTTTMNDESALISSRIVLRINNAFSASYPIVVSNGDFAFDVATSDLGRLTFTLVDANMKEVKLLNPMYLTIKVKPIPDEKIWNLDAEIYYSMMGTNTRGDGTR